MFTGYAPPAPEGRTRRALAWAAQRRDPSLRTDHRWPYWVRHPFRWLALLVPRLAIKLLIVAVFGYPKVCAPFIAAALLWATAAIGGNIHNGYTTIAFLGLTAAAPAWWYAGLNMGKVTLTRSYWWMRYGVIATWATGAALTIAASTHAYRGLIGSGSGSFLVWAILAGTASGWWVDAAGKKPEEQCGPLTVDERIATYAERCASDGKRLNGTAIRDLEPLAGIEGAWTATLDASATELETAQLCNAAGYIAARFGLPPTSVTVEGHPSLRNDLARLMVFPTNPLQQIQLFDNITLDKATGWITVGTHTDGRPARWRLWVPGWGACHGLIFGTTGAGKSGLLSAIFTEARNSRLICICFGDPAMGESAPDWQENVTAFAGTFPRICEMLQGVERMMDERRAQRRRTRWKDERGFWRRGSGKFTPTEADPMLLVAIDEFSDLAKDPVYGPECLRIIARICKQGRKYGVAILLLTQIPSLEEMGDNQAIRSMASGMNIAAFRTSDAMSATMGLPMSLPIDPVDLPALWPNGELTAGLGFLARSDAPASPMRGRWVEDTIWWANSGDPIGLPAEMLAAGGRFFDTWFELLDVEEDDVIYLDGNGDPVRVGDGAAGIAQIAQATGKAGKSTAWDKIKVYLAKDENRTYGASTKMIAEDLGLERNTVQTTLRRYESEKYGQQCHEVPDRAGMWLLGPVPAGAVDVDDDGRDGELVSGNPTVAEHWSAAKDPMTASELVA